MNNDEDIDYEWERLWTERLSALEGLFGKSADDVGHSTVPFELGPEAGGGADVVYFDQWMPGRLTVTAELLGADGQLLNDQGFYELAICHRDNQTWGPNLISRLAHYTLQAVLNPGETMDIGPAVPEGSNIAAFLFEDLGRFDFRGHKAGVLLCIGITQAELDECRAGRTERVVKALRRKGIYPHTDLIRNSVV